jgi:hypothetical protein
MKCRGCSALGLVLLTAVGLASCGLGGRAGLSDSLETEIAEVSGELYEVARSVWSDAYVDLGQFVDVGQCDPDEAWRASVIHVYGPVVDEDGSVLRAALEEYLSSQAIKIDNSLPGSPGAPIWFTRRGTGIQIKARSGQGAVEGVEVGATTDAMAQAGSRRSHPMTLRFRRANASLSPNDQRGHRAAADPPVVEPGCSC